MTAPHEMLWRRISEGIGAPVQLSPVIPGHHKVMPETVQHELIKVQHPAGIGQLQYARQHPRFMEEVSNMPKRKYGCPGRGIHWRLYSHALVIQ